MNCSLIIFIMILIYFCFKEWVLGKAIGVGGFGELYLASSKQNGKLSQENFVIKVRKNSMCEITVATWWPHGLSNFDFMWNCEKTIFFSCIYYILRGKDPGPWIISRIKFVSWKIFKLVFISSTVNRSVK